MPLISYLLQSLLDAGALNTNGGLVWDTINGLSLFADEVIAEMDLYKFEDRHDRPKCS
jgi:hypothetical protein